MKRKEKGKVKGKRQKAKVWTRLAGVNYRLKIRGEGFVLTFAFLLLPFTFPLPFYF